MPELDKYIKMIPGSSRKKIHIDLHKLTEAFMKEGFKIGVEAMDAAPGKAQSQGTASPESSPPDEGGGHGGPG